MNEVYENRSECPIVERFIWDKVSIDFGDFVGIKRFSYSDLVLLHSMITQQLYDMTPRRPEIDP